MTECNKSVYLANKSIDMIDAVNKGYTDGYNEAIDDFAETLIPRLTDAIYPKDVEGMRNLINDVAEQLKEGGTEWNARIEKDVDFI